MKFDSAACVLDDYLVAMGQNTSFLGPAGTGKTRLLEQLAVANIVQHKTFLGLPLTTRSLRWLFLQAENDNRRLQTDLVFLKAWVGETAWEAVEKQLVIHTLENDFDQVLFLDQPKTVDAIRELVQDTKPNGVVWDCLQYFSIGELNKDADMFQTAWRISQITKENDVTRFPVAIHHALTGIAGISKVIGRDRSSFGRNSKVMFAWCRGQVNIAPANIDNADRLIIGCGKCSNGKEFEPFSAVLNAATHIYERDDTFDVQAWHRDVCSSKGKTPLIGDKMILDALNGGGKSQAYIVADVLSKSTYPRSTVYRAFARVLKSKLIRHDKKTDLYYRV
jgi:hypothetical protein